MIKINLIAETKRAVATRKAAPKLSAGIKDLGQALLVAGLLAGLLVAGGWWYLLRSDLKRTEEQVAAAQKEVDELAQVLKEVEDYKVKKAELEHKIEVINQLKLNQKGPVQIMDQVSRSLPELLWLNALDVTASNVVIKGQAFNTNAVANFLENLDRVPEFQEPILRDTQRKGQAYDFSINFGFQLKPPPAQSTAGGQAAGGTAPAAR